MNEENAIARESLISVAIGALILFGLLIFSITNKYIRSDNTKKCCTIGMVIGGIGGAILLWAAAFAIIAYEKAWDMFFGGFAIVLLFSVLAFIFGKHSKVFQYIALAVMMSISILCTTLVSVGIRPPLDPNQFFGTVIVGFGVIFCVPLIGFAIGGFAIGIPIALLVAIISGKRKVK